MSPRGSGRLVIVGDSLLDIDTIGVVHRLSPDGPVPVVQDAVDESRAGGAALAATLAADTGRPVQLVTPLAEDADARRLESLLPATVELIAIPWTGQTPVKNRLRAGGHTVARIDRGRCGPIGPIPAAARAAIEAASVVVVADYGYGTTAQADIRDLLAGVARRRPVVWDPHPNGAQPVPGCTLVTPNQAEALGTQHSSHPPDLAAVAERAAQLRRQWQVNDVVVTLGPAGALSTVGDGAALVVPAPRIDLVDACGAGDRFAATVGWALADGALPTEAVAAGVGAASAFLAGGGLSRPPQRHPRAGLQPSSGVLVASGGCFDLLHAGHVATLEAARAMGDRLVVCVNSDASVRRLKGPGRPLQPAADRVRILEALGCVDEVVIFDESTPETVLRHIRPQLWVKGGDYAGSDIPEQRVLAEWGGRVVTVPFLPGRSTTGLAHRAGHRLGADTSP